MGTILCSFPEIFGSYSKDENPNPSKFPMHTHFQYELFYFIAGEAVYHVEGSEYTLQPGDMMLMRPAEAHYIEPKPGVPYERVVINFDGSIFSAIDPQGNLLRAYTNRESGKGNLYRKEDFTDCDSSAFIKLLYDHRADRVGSIATMILLLCAINRVFDNAPPAHAQTDGVEYRLLRYINNHLSMDLDLEHLTQRYFISRAQLCRRFKKATGTSVGRYINAKRLVAAKTMIISGKKPTEVYTACGFTDYSTFYRAYCKYFGHSPKDESAALCVQPQELLIE